MSKMIENIAKIIFDYLNENNSLIKDKELYNYAILLTIHEVITYFIVLVVSIVCNATIETILYIILFSTIRKFTGGYHARSYSQCTVLYLLFYLIFLALLLNRTYLTIPIMVLLLVISIVYIIKNTPVQHINSPLSLFEEDKYRKYSIRILLGYVIIILMFVILWSKISLMVTIVIIFDGLLMLMLKKSSDYKEGYYEHKNSNH